MAKKKAVKKVVKKKAVKKKAVELSKAVDMGTEAVSTEVVVSCKCCTKLVKLSKTILCGHCSFQGCRLCVTDERCPTCGKGV